MREYDFSGLSTRSFEKLVQALAAKILGPGLVVFGDGPDGGREATFEGKVPFPSLAKGWNGYTVVQAKFRQRPEGSAADGKWAANELKNELKQFADQKKNRRVPRNYLFVTNVVLTPVGKSGSKDRLTKIIADFQARVPIRGFRVWDYDQLRTYLDGSEDIRRAFLPFITAGDVLAQAIQSIHGTRSEFEEVMTSYLANELTSTQFANLERAGEQKILLARVFVDLPSSTEPSLDPPVEDPKKVPQRGFVSRFVSVASDRLDPESQSGGRPKALRENEQQAGRYVLVGGPGQGKTTIGQFACQLFRTAILLERTPHLVAAEVRDAMTKIEQLCARDAIELPRARRFPVHVTLSEFATALNKRGKSMDEEQSGSTPLTLLGFIADKINQRTGREISQEDLRSWLSNYAWLLVLDGLDEVPSSSNRGEVLKTIEQFWIDMTQTNSDILVLATTRPQDYHGDFSPRYYRHEWLTPLSPKLALEYGSRLVDEKYSPNQDRCRRVLNRLDRAASEENTARLMRTPLQVTIMTTLLDQIGSPPQDRWRLFGEYYQAIYRREMERDTQKELLSRHRTDINIIHYRVGLELQVLSEKAGNTYARLTPEQFRLIVRGRLEEQGHEGRLLENLEHEIVDLAANRLVFLVGLDAESVGFEIRSLQEFMAAEALMSGPTAAVQDRLRSIAPVASWRNVFIFAAGRCFAQDEELVDTIQMICVELNADLAGERGRVTRAGSLLAIDLLEDGSVNAKPRSRKLLARTARDLIVLPPSDGHRRLADVQNSDLDPTFRDVIDDGLKQPRFDDRIGSWAVIAGLANRDPAWASFGDERWPADIRERAVICDLGPDGSGWLTRKRLETIPELPFGSRGLWLRDLGSVPWAQAEQNTATRVPVKIAIDSQTDFEVGIITMESFIEFSRLVSGMPAKHVSRNALVAASSHLNEFDEHALSEVLLTIAESFEAEQPFEYFLPWLIAAPALTSNDGTELRALAERIATGAFGNATSWRQAEKRWKRPVQVEELRIPDDPWPPAIGTVGFPFRVAVLGSKNNERIIRRVEAFCRELPAGNLRRWFSDQILWNSWVKIPEILWPAETLLALADSQDYYILSQLLNSDSDDLASTLKFFTFVGDSTSRVQSMRAPIAQQLVALIEGHPGDGALIRAIALADYYGENRSVATDVAKTLPIDVSRDIPRFDIRYRVAAAAVVLARGIKDDKEAVTLATLFGDDQESRLMIGRCLSFAKERNQFTSTEDRFFLALEKQLGRSNWRTHQRLIDYLSESLRRQKSDLDRPEVWRRLALPSLVAQ